MSTLKGKAISSTYQTILKTAAEIKDTNLKSVETGSGNITAMKLSTDKAEFTKVGVGTAGSTPDGLLHVMGVSAGAVSSSTFANQLTLENSSDAGLTILSGTDSSGNIFFGDSSDNDAGQIYYDHSQDYLGFSTNGSEKMRIDKNGNLNVSGTISQSEDRYGLSEYFHNLPYRDIQEAEINQATDATTAVTNHTKSTRITMQSHDLAASDTVEFVFNNVMIHDKSHVIAYIINSSGAIADNAMVNVMVHDIANGSCKIRIGTNATDIAAQTFEIQVIVDSHIKANDHWSLSGTNAREDWVSYPGTQPGIRVITNSADNDQVILNPKVTNLGNNNDLINTSPWRNVNFHSQYQTELNIAISTHSTITSQAIWAGMKLSTTGPYTGDTDQAYFLYATDDDMGTLTNNGNWHFVYSIGGVDYVTDLGIAVVASTVYRLKLAFDENRQISVFINSVKYGLTTTPTTTTPGGVTQPVVTTKSLAMTSGTALRPVVAIQNLSASLRFLYTHFIKISRTLA